MLSFANREAFPSGKKPIERGQPIEMLPGQLVVAST